jgi:predicted XRE-type DNA-binding protein
MTEPNIPNLDCMSIEELRAFWKQHHVTTKARAAVLLGVARPDGKEVVETLANYAMSKMTAMSARLEGKIDTAMTYEEHAQLAYDRLPKDCRW